MCIVAICADVLITKSIYICNQAYYIGAIDFYVTLSNILHVSLQPHHHLCIDSDPCSPHPCHSNAECMVTLNGSFECQCIRFGYEGDGTNNCQGT